MHTIKIVDNLELNPFDSLVSDVALEYGLSFADAGELVSKLYIKSVEELDDRYLGHYSVYNNTYELEHDIYEVHGRNIPYRIVHNLIVADKPL